VKYRCITGLRVPNFSVEGNAVIFEDLEVPEELYEKTGNDNPVTRLDIPL